MFKRFFAFYCLMTLLAGSVAVISAQDDLIQIAQWADEAEASSQYGDDDWSADQATGRPDVRACEDSVEAWASEFYSGSIEHLTLTFDDEVIPTQVNIYQNLTPGAIVGIEIIPDSRREDPVLLSVEDQRDDCPSVLSIDLPDDMPESSMITIYLEQDLVGYWNEIDAVELVGLIEGDKDDEQESSIEEGDYDEYEVYSVDAEETDTVGGNATEGFDATYNTDWGLDVGCREGGGIQDAIELKIIQQRTGNQYRVTAIGLNGFDPVLAVTLSGEYNNALCSDDDGEAASYSANLPTTGNVPAVGTSSQVIFNLNSSNDFENVSILVAGFDGSSGEVLLIIEGMYASSLDGVGDPMSLSISPALVESGVAPTAYMISVVGRFDPMMYMADSELGQVYDTAGNPLLCDDAGDSSNCWGTGSSLRSSYVSRSQNRQLAGGQLDSMITYPLVPSNVGFFLNYVMTSFGSTEGDYVLAFHLGYQAED